MLLVVKPGAPSSFLFLFASCDKLLRRDFRADIDAIQGFLSKLEKPSKVQSNILLVGVDIDQTTLVRVIPHGGISSICTLCSPNHPSTHEKEHHENILVEKSLPTFLQPHRVSCLCCVPVVLQQGVPQFLESASDLHLFRKDLSDFKAVCSSATGRRGCSICLLVPQPLALSQSDPNPAATLPFPTSR